MKGMVTPQLLGGLGRKLGLSEDMLKSSMGGVAGTFMHSLSGRADDRSSMGQLSQLVNESPQERDDVDQLIDAPDDSPLKRRSTQLLDLATGGNPASMTGMIGRFLGLGGGAATGLVGAIAALAMSAFRKLGRTKQLDASSLGSLLHSERSSYRDAIPAKWRDEVLGRPTPEPRRAEGVRYVAPPARPRRLWWLVLVPIALLVVWTATRDHHAPSEHTARSGQRPSEISRDAVRSGGEQPKAEKPTTADQQVLAQARAPSGTSIALDKVTFATGSSQLARDADAQITTVARALEENPTTHMTITGSPDATGGVGANQALARARAESVRDALVAKGIDPSRIRVQATGGGDRSPRTVSVEFTGQG
jgi:outer membrane protein OmpA-like peptidoglycan-associated protein